MQRLQFSISWLQTTEVSFTSVLKTGMKLTSVLKTEVKLTSVVWSHDIKNWSHCISLHQTWDGHIPYRTANFNRSLKACYKNEFFTNEIIRFTNKISELFLETNFKLFSLIKMRNKNNHLYLKMLLILSSDIKLKGL